MAYILAKKNHFTTHGSTSFMLTRHKLSNSKSSSCTTQTTCPFHVHSHATCTAVAQTRETPSAVCLHFALCTSASKKLYYSTFTLSSQCTNVTFLVLVYCLVAWFHVWGCQLSSALFANPTCTLRDAGNTLCWTRSLRGGDWGNNTEARSAT